MSAAVGFTAASGITPVFAQETTNAEVIKEDVEAKKTKKEKLEDSVKTAKSNLDDVKKVSDEKKVDADAAKKELEDVSAAQDKQYAVVENQYDKAYGSVNEDYQALLSKASDLEEEIASKQAELDQYTKNEESAAKNLEEAKKDLADKQAKLDEVNKELAKYDKTSIDADLKTAETEQEKAQTAYNSAKKANEDAASALTIANGDLNTKKEALNNAQKAYDDAAADVNAKQEAVNVAQANVDSFTGSDALTNAQKELDQAKTELVNAQTIAKNAETALDSANTELSEAETTQQSAQSEYDKSVKSLDEAKKALEEATKKQATAKEAYEVADKNAKDNQSIVDKLTQKQTECQTAVNKAQTAFDSNKSEKEVAQEKLNTFINENKSTIDQINKGTQGFFEYVSTDLGKLTSQAFDKNNATYSKIAAYVKLGQEGDATSIENMKAVIPWLKKTNDLRAKHNLNALNVSLWEMALAQANSDWAQENIKHSGIYDHGENLSWGYQDPFDGWYDEEKAIYDTFDDSLKQLSANDLSKKYPDKYNQVGHYLNIVHPNFTSFGMGHSSIGDYGRNDSQDFLFRQIHSSDVIMTVDDFEKKLTEYENKINTVKKEYKTKQDAVANASDAKDNSAVLKAQKALKDANAQLDSVKNKLEAPTAKQKELNAKVDEANKALVAANTEVADKTKDKTNAETEKIQKASELDTAKSNVASKKKVKELAEINKAATDKVVDDKQSQVDQLNNKINNWNASKAEAEKQLADANSALNEAKGKLDGATDNLTPVKKAYNAAVAVQAKVESDSMAANSAFVSADTLLQEKNGSLAKARKALANYNDAVKAIKDASEAVAAQVALIDKYTKEAEDASAAIKETTKKISLLVDSKDELDSKVEAKKKVLDVIDDVKVNGSRANTSSITDEELLGYLDELAKEVDEFEELHIKFANANVKYMTLLSVYEEAKKDEAQAQTVYDEAMKALDTYILETSKHAVKTENNTNKNNVVTTNKNGNTSGAKKAYSTNTGVETGLGLDVAMMGVATLGIVEAKRRSKKQ